MYNRIEEAIHFATIAHGGQKRRNEEIDFVFHPLSVGFMLARIGCNEETIISGILHDVIEDTLYTYEDLLEKFGIVVADNVALISEDMTIQDWRKRKELFIDKLKDMSYEVALIECADKLHNLLSDLEVYKKIGMRLFESSSTVYENIAWYYKEMLALLKTKIEKENVLLIRLEKLVDFYFE